MTVELTHQDLINLVKGRSPGYEKMDEIIKRGLGTYIGGFADEWRWDNFALNKLTDEELYELYKSLRHE